MPLPTVWLTINAILGHMSQFPNNPMIMSETLYFCAYTLYQRDRGRICNARVFLKIAVRYFGQGLSQNLQRTEYN